MIKTKLLSIILLSLIGLFSACKQTSEAILSGNIEVKNGCSPNLMGNTEGISVNVFADLVVSEANTIQVSTMEPIKLTLMDGKWVGNYRVRLEATALSSESYWTNIRLDKAFGSMFTCSRGETCTNQIVAKPEKIMLKQVVVSGAGTVQKQLFENTHNIKIECACTNANLAPNNNTSLSN